VLGLPTVSNFVPGAGAACKRHKIRENEDCLRKEVQENYRASSNPTCNNTELLERFKCCGKRKLLNGAFFGQICFAVKCVCCIWICCNANEKWSSFVDDLKEREMGL
jgi:hypothetical protein